MTVAVRLLATLLSRIAGIALLGMIAVNVGDVTLRNVFGIPTLGAYEMIELLLAAVAFLAIPEAFLRENHITVELIDQVVSERVVGWLRMFGAALVVLYLVLLAWKMVQPALDFAEFGEVTMELRVPMAYPAFVILAGIVGSVIAALLSFFREIARYRHGTGR